MTREKKSNQKNHTTKNPPQKPPTKQTLQKEPLISEMKIKCKANFCRISKNLFNTELADCD